MNEFPNLFKRHPELIGSVWPKWSNYIPILPTGKQLAALMLPHLEIFYGGAAGGGKSVWLLISALQYCDVPGYSSILFRKTLQDLRLAGSLMDLSFQWLMGWPSDDPGRPVWKPQESKWLFPCGPDYSYHATLQFGYIGGGGELEGSISNRYQSAAFQFIGFDELAHHFQGDFEFMFSRLRGPALPCVNCRTPVEQQPMETDDGEPRGYVWSHVNDVDCQEPLPDPVTLKSYPPSPDGVRVFDIPLRMRAASNPPRAGDAGNGSDEQTGKPWIKARYQIQAVPLAPEDSLNSHPTALKYLAPNEGINGEKITHIYKGVHPERQYIPAFVWDNPYLKQAEYLRSLSNLDPITRGQQLRGDWGVAADGRFKRAWVRRYSFNGDTFVMGPNRRPYQDAGGPPRFGVWHKNEMTCFLTVDPAATTKEGPGDMDIYRNRAPSWTVVCVWLFNALGDLLLLKVKRLRCEVPEVLQTIRQEHKWCMDNGYHPTHVGIENNGINLPIYQIMLRSGLPIRGYNPGLQDPLGRASDACNRMEQGKIYLPQEGSLYPVTKEPLDFWLEIFENELFTWIGHPHETDDQIACLSYAAIDVSRWAAETHQIERPIAGMELPFAM